MLKHIKCNLSDTNFTSAGALFSTGEIYINDTLISMAGSLYSYRAYIESLLL